MILKCHRCKHGWDYQGHGKFYVTCPHCYSKIRLVNTTTDIKSDDKISRIQELSESGRLGISLMGILELLKRQNDDIEKLKDELKATRITLLFLIARTDVNIGPKPSGDAMDEVAKRADSYIRMYESALASSRTSAETSVSATTKLIKFPKLPFEEISNLQGDTA